MLHEPACSGAATSSCDPATWKGSVLRGEFPWAKLARDCATCARSSWWSVQQRTPFSIMGFIKTPYGLMMGTGPAYEVQQALLGSKHNVISMSILSGMVSLAP